MYPTEDAPAESASQKPPKTRKARTKTERAPGPLFDHNGLRAATAARAVLARGPLTFGEDSRFWAFRNGVWIPGEKLVHARIVGVLDERHRGSSGDAIRDVLRAWVPEIECAPTPQYINFRNGLLDWRTGELRPHDPAVLSTVQLGCDWNPKATCERFRRFVAEVVPAPDIARVWEMTGYLMMSGNPLQKALMLTGSGSNGKGALMRLWHKLLGGKSNVSAVTLHALSDNRFAAARLYGRLANMCGDIDNTFIEKTGVFKQAMGEDPIDCEHKYGQPFNFTNWATMVFSANEIPGASDSSDGWHRRWEVMHFPNRFKVPDPTLEPELQADDSLAGIAVTAVSALRLLMARREFERTDTAVAAHDELKRKANAILVWLDERAEELGAEDAFTPRTTAYLDYVRWSEADGVKFPMTRRRFYERIRLAHVPETKRGVEGFRLKLRPGM